MKRCSECRRAAHAGHLPTCSQSVARQRITPASKQVAPMLTDKFMDDMMLGVGKQMMVEVSKNIDRRQMEVIGSMFGATGSLDVLLPEYDNRRFYPVIASNKPAPEQKYSADSMFDLLRKFQEIKPMKLTFWSSSLWPTGSFARIEAPHAEPNEIIFLGHPDTWRDDRLELTSRMPNLLTDIPITNIEQDGPERDRFLEIFKNAFGQSPSILSSAEFTRPMRDDQ